jgi:hypothetical protein
VTTEHAVYTMGQDLFFSVEEALRALEVQPQTARDIARAARGGKSGTFAAIIVSPLDVPSAQEQVALKAAQVRYEAHPIPRAVMERAANALAPQFDLMVRQLEQ